MKKLLGGIAISALLAAPAMAADIPARMPVKAPPPLVAAAVYNWTGFYVGVHGGGAWGKVSGLYDGDGGDLNLGGLKDNTAIFGGQVGYNWQRGNFVFGVEVDASRGFRKSSIAASAAAGTPEVSSELDWLFSARARAGIALGAGGEWLPFVTAGWGYASHEFSVVSGGAGPGFGPYGSVHVRGGGFVGGGGLEYGITPWASLQVEGLHYATGKRRNFADNEFNDADVGDFVRYRGITVVRGALNFRFGGGPVVARY